MKNSLLKRIFVFITVSSIIAQSLSPYVAILSQRAYAQEVTDQATTNETVTPTPEQNVAPAQDQAVVTETVTPTPIETTQEVTPTPTDVPSEVTPSDVNNNSPPSENQVNNSSSATTTPATTSPAQETVTPTTTPAENPKDEQLNLIVLDNVSAPSIDLQAVESQGSAILTTDKPDYAPTDSALITGSNLLPNTTYTLKVWSDNEPPTGITAEIVSDQNGVFAYAYQLDGTYRPNYSAELKDLAGNVVATVTFTDSDTSFKFPTATHTPNNWDTNTVANVQSSNNSYILDNDETDEQGYSSFNFPSIPVGSTVNGIEVSIEAKSTDTSGCSIFGSLSWNNGTNYTSFKSTPSLTGSDASYTLGGANDNWGRTWGNNDFLNSNFVLKMYYDDTSGSSCSGSTVSVDQLLVKVTYTEAAVSVPPYPASGCFNDAQGVDDEPGQKDLTKMCADGSNIPTSIATWWNWDDTAWSGNNTGSACNLFDTDGDGNANYSMCVFVGGTPATFQSRTLYSCGDDRADRCTNPLASVTTTATCNSQVQNEDPFNSSDDTVGYCSTNLSELGNAANVNLIDVCSYPSEQPNSDPSDCIFYKKSTGKLIVNKVVVPSADTGKFNLQIDSINKAVDVSNGGTTGEQILDAGTHTVGEIAGTGTSLTNYTSAIDCKLLHGTGNSIASSLTSGPLNVSIADGDDIVCTITNTRVNNGTLTIIKDANPNDGQDFAFTTSGAGLSSFSLDDDSDITLSNTKTFSNLSAGTYSVAETPVAGWNQTSAVCNDGSPINAINVSNGENVTCTFTNTKYGSVTVVKNTNFGNSTFPFTTTGGLNPSSFNITTVNGSGSQVYSSVLPGTYSVTENTPASWIQGSISCLNGTAPIGTVSGSTASFSLTAGQNIVCTFTNTGQGNLKIVKNTVGGDSTFGFNVTGPTPLTPSLTTVNGTKDTGLLAVTTGTYSVTENSVPSGWTQTNSTCTNGQASFSTSNFSVGAGETITCTFTNTRDTGSVKVNKRVDTNGDGDYSDTGEGLNDTASNVFNWSLDTIGSNAMGSTVSGVSTGTHAINENSVSGYSFVGWFLTSDTSKTCSNTPNHTLPTNLTVSKGQTAEITLCNKRDTGTLRVLKNVDKNGDGDYTDSGETGATDWQWQANNGSNHNTGDSAITVATGDYALAETMKPGYHFVSLSCTGGTLNTQTNTVSVAKGANAVCTFTNAHDTGTVTVNKVLVPSNDSGRFDLEINGTTYANNIGNNGTTGAKIIATGNVTVSEDDETGTDLSNYITTYSCSNQVAGSGTSTNFTLSANQNVVCTFTNTRKASIKIVKDSLPNDNDDFTFDRSFGSDFTLEDDGNNNDGQPDSVTYSNLSAGAYTITEHAYSDWKLNNLSCTGGGQPNINLNGRTVTVNLSAGENVICTFENLKLGKIYGEKFNDKNGNNQDDGSDEPDLSGWTIFIDLNNNGILDQGEVSTTTNSGGDYSFENLVPGTYRVCEVQQNGWFSSLPNNETCISTTIHSNGGDQDRVDFANHQSVVIKAYKVVCDNESDLPNWGNGAPDITSTTAQNYVNSHPSCHLESGWDFQYGFGSKSGNPGVQTYGNGDQLGLAPMGTGYNSWKMLGTTSGTPAEISISNLENASKIWVRENLKPNYVPFSYPPGSTPGNSYSAEIYCDKDGLNYDNFDFVSSPKYGSTYHCVAFNALNTGDLEVTKFFDTNKDGVKQQDEQVLSGWTINVSGQTSKVTGQDGKVVFNDITSGNYQLSEDLQDGWEQTGISCSTDKEENNEEEVSRNLILIDNNGHTVHVNPNQTTTCTVGNYTRPILTISKSNNTGGADQAPGNNVLFTLTISATQSAAKNVTVKDLLPQGFTYNSDSWTFASNLNGSLVVTEPTYASPGTWNLGDMQKGETITLTYTAKISGDQQTGTYKDLAWAQGNALNGDGVLALAEPTGYVDVNFVGTDVSLVNNSKPGVDYKASSTKEVLGASTYLPATGESTLWVIIATLLLGFGFGTTFVGLKLRKKYE
jgi:hypothetical protein